MNGEEALDTLGAVLQKAAARVLPVGYQTQTIRIPTGTGAITIEQEVSLDSNYKQLTGIALFELAAQANVSYRIGVRDENRAILQRNSKKLIEAVAATGASDRFLPVKTEAGRKVYITIDIVTPLVADLEFDVVFRLQTAGK
jgi:hypothetical protein